MAALRKHVLEPFVPRCIDREYGGFLVDFDEHWRPVGPHDKTLEHASRTTVAFALLDQALPGEGYDQFVRHGCAFLQSALWDADHGGFFARVERSGQPAWQGLKHPHAVTYAATAFLLADRHLAPGEGRSWAKRALDWLDDVAWDREHAGYWGSFDRNNARFPDGARLPTPDGRDVVGLRPGYKELNTLCDSIEMLTTFVTHGIGGSCADRLELLVSLVVDRLSDSRGVLPYLYGRDWRPVPDLLRIGQNFQMIHRLVAVARVNDTMAPIASARGIADFCLASARHPSGGFCLAVTADGRTWPATGPTTDLRQWWVQLEAATALHVLATHLTTDAEAAARFSRARDEQWAFLRNHFFDAQSGGIWELPAQPSLRGYARLQSWLQPKSRVPRRKAHGWKDPLHEIRTFLALRSAKGNVP